MPRQLDKKEHVKNSSEDNEEDWEKSRYTNSEKEAYRHSQIITIY